MPFSPPRRPVVQRIGQEAFSGLYSPTQQEFPAIRFHKNPAWKKALQTEGKIHGDAYSLRDYRFDPILPVLAKTHLAKYKEDWVKLGLHEKYAAGYGSLAGYNAALKATVERVVHRTITQSLSESVTVADALNKILSLGPALIVDAKTGQAYERYRSPDSDEYSLGKVGKRDFAAESVLAELPLVNDRVQLKLAPILDQGAVANTLKIRAAIIDCLFAEVETFLESRYKPKVKAKTIASIPRSYRVPSSFNENSPELLEALEELDDEISKETGPPSWLAAFSSTK